MDRARGMGARGAEKGLLGEPEPLCRAAALDAGNGDRRRATRASPGHALGQAPAARAAGEALFLLFDGARRGIHPAEDLIHRLSMLQIALRKPAFAVVRAAPLVAPPVDIRDGVLGRRVVHQTLCLSSNIAQHRSRSVATSLRNRLNQRLQSLYGQRPDHARRPPAGFARMQVYSTMMARDGRRDWRAPSPRDVK